MTLAPRAMRVGVPVVAVFALLELVAPAGRACGQEGPTAAAQTPAVRGYVIGPSDVLQIIVWKEPELTRDVTVRFDGMITVPLLGDVEAAGRTPGQLAESLAKGLKQFVETPGSRSASPRPTAPASTSSARWAGRASSPCRAA